MVYIVLYVQFILDDKFSLSWTIFSVYLGRLVQFILEDMFSLSWTICSVLFSLGCSMVAGCEAAVWWLVVRLQHGGWL